MQQAPTMTHRPAVWVPTKATGASEKSQPQVFCKLPSEPAEDSRRRLLRQRTRTWFLHNGRNRDDAPAFRYALRLAGGLATARKWRNTREECSRNQIICNW